MCFLNCIYFCHYFITSRESLNITDELAAMKLVVSNSEGKKTSDTLRDGDAFEAEFAAWCRPAAASCPLITGPASSKAHLCLYVPFESSSVAACAVNLQHRDILQTKKQKTATARKRQPTHRR